MGSAGLNFEIIQYDDSQHSTIFISGIQGRCVCSLLVTGKHDPLCHYTHGFGQVYPICVLRESFVEDRIRDTKSIRWRNRFYFEICSRFTVFFDGNIRITICQTLWQKNGTTRNDKQLSNLNGVTWKQPSEVNLRWAAANHLIVQQKSRCAVQRR